jgi:hypothetical protein
MRFYPPFPQDVVYRAFARRKSFRRQPVTLKRDSLLGHGYAIPTPLLRRILPGLGRTPSV